MSNHIAIAALVALLAVAPAARAQAPQKTPPVRKPRVVIVDPYAPRGFLLGRVEILRPSDAVFRDVYGSPAGFEGEIRGRATRQIYLSAAFGWIGKSGELTVTRETTKLTMYPLEGMVLFYVAPGHISPYVAGGVAAYRYSESNPIGAVSEWDVGYVAAGGVTLHMNRRFAIDGRVKYTSVKVNPAETEANLGGISLGVGGGIKF